ncbi:organic solute transporter subunit alpha [Papilio machaon]|uniref:organic solute transporter subunit alpha n=1 Tax=Papilio machaon TaxID=76193 RepID=UPI001E66405B|nr:organic solute transporter subunit alpha [Papilio machaon]
MSLSEESSGDGILASRHVSPETTHHENNAMNTTLLCHNFTLEPDFISYLTALQPYAWVLWTSGLVVLILLWTIYAVTLRSAVKKRRESSTNLATVLSVYPLVASAAYIAIVVPRATLVAEAIAQEVVMVAMYNFFCLIIAECGGPSQFIRRAGESRLETRVLPCCCWPCCIIPRPKIDKRSLTWLRCLVLQIPIVQGVLYVIILVLWAEDMMIYRHVIVFIQFFVAASILSGMWGVIMCVRAANGIGVVLRPKFVALQLVLIIVKLQCGLSKLLSDLAMLPCVMSLHPTVLVNVTQYTITIFEMLLLSIWAWRLYGAAETKSLNKVQKVVVAVLEEGTGVLDGKQRKEGVDNKSFNITDNKCEDKV